MKIILIIIVVTILFYVIIAIKENESRETVEKERKVNNNKIADIHFQNLLQNELNRQKLLKVTHQNIILELESLEHIKSAIIDDGVLKVEVNNEITRWEALEFSHNLINSLNSTTEINAVKLLNKNKIVVATANRKNI
ncbi:hypothetical protein [Flavobacterium psychraquaticum]|uniref:hypothetical protein n=1 Tax=Flavobacterium psychraquaticum TaxID=3103958 RepID=UPI002ACE39B3|nr:hypothetical protein [Flavobacterium sp. LB-N7T]